MPAWITRLGHATPAHVVEQGAFAAWAEARLAPGSDRARFARFAAHAGVERRHTVIDLLGDEGAGFYPVGAPGAGMQARSRAFAHLAAPLAAAAVRAACPDGLPPITHLVVATCTGAVAPGLDLQLLRLLGLPATVRRSSVAFMGCYAAIPALRVARDAVLAHAGARALVVCCELSSLHFQPGPADDALLAACLFGDGAAAALVESGEAAAGLGLRIAGDASMVVPDSAEQMAWEAAEDGFRIRLDPRVSRSLALDLGPFCDRLLAGRARGQARWAVHPGGPRILDDVERQLALPPGALDASREALRTAGNRSSATVLAILAEMARDPWRGPAACLAFGPGLTAEGLLLEREP